MQKMKAFFSTSKLQMVISSLGVLALIAFSSVIVFEAMKTTVVINDNGIEKKVQTYVKTVADVLDEVGITVGKHDDLSHSLDAEVESGMTIDYQTAKQVTMNIDGDQETFYTTKDTIKDFLHHHHLNFTEHDELSHELDEDIKDGMQIDVTKAFQMTVDNGGQEKEYWTTGGTVEQFFAENDITYDKSSHDKLNVKLTDEIKEDMKIKLVHVEKDKEEIEEAIPFEIEKRKDDSLEKGKKRVISEGKEGLAVKTYVVTKENGKKVDKKLDGTEIKEESKNKVVAVGTKENPKDDGNLVTLSSKKSKNNQSNNSPKSNKKMTMSASAYTASCNGCSGHTSTGIDLKANPNKKVVAVDPSVIPLGTKVWVEGYGEAVAADTGGNIQGKRIDLHFPSKGAALAFGQKSVTVKILD